ncbi:receptor-type tyrosine-protein phosphatase alpha-like isoform X2 [Apostichopus japonicus]|uniref:receptor-type tyrosine-protein phosphatase alpha-like isoform X2 n=1 Tax=Stichopus japonicus TaxID=307972 RepID=UPI003AB83488
MKMEILYIGLSVVVMAIFLLSVFLGSSGSKLNFTRTFSRRSRRTKRKRNDTEKRDMGDEWERPPSSSARNGERSPKVDRSPQRSLEQRSNHMSSAQKSFVKRTPPLKGKWPQKRNPIKLNEFLTCYQRMASADPSEFTTEYLDLPASDISRCKVANTESNKKKNRFKNILPYDDCRVKLNSSLDGSDYINASYIQGVFKGVVNERLYIATQGPLEHTIPDFWQMIWEQNSPVIVMLTNPIEKRKVKCAQYWPEQGTNRDVQVMKLQGVEENVEPFYVARKIKMIKGNEWRTLMHYQFTSWDDKATLETAMPIWQVLDEIGQELQHKDLQGSLTIHCSAGIGRTGTFIALAVLRSLLFHASEVNVYNIVFDMRTRRMSMVQIEEQYKFIYESLVIWYLLKQTSFRVSGFRRDMKDWWRNVKTAQRKRTEDEFRLLGFICPPKRCRTTQAGELPENRDKNRFPNLIPVDEHRPLLMTKPPYDSNPNNYINACFHHSFQKKNAFLATQSPLNTTVGAFWSLIVDYNVCSIVEFTDQNQKADKYCPLPGYEINYGVFSVTCTSTKDSQHRIFQRRLTLHSKQKGTREMKIFSVDVRQTQDDLAQSITTVANNVQEWQRDTGNGPIVVHCQNGVGLSGCFMAIYSAIDRLNAQHMIDVFTTVRRLRETRPQVVDSLERYMMIYEALNAYLIHTEQSYSNFHDF